MTLNLLEIARKSSALDGLNDMSPDKNANAPPRTAAPDAKANGEVPQTAAAVNEYVTLIQETRIRIACQRPESKKLKN